MDNDEEEYEYEYSTNETETFYIDLDLSSVNNVLKSQNANDRKSLGPGRPQASSAVTTPKKPKGKSKNRQDPEDDDDNDEDEQENEDEDDVQAEEATPARRGSGGGNDEKDDNNEEQQDGAERNSDAGVDESGDSIQILELHSHNPFISYRNQIYSCEWVDMIGTGMFFTKHNETPIHEPQISTEDYDLISTSRIKLVGYKAKVTAKPNPQPARAETATRTTRAQKANGKGEAAANQPEDAAEEANNDRGASIPEARSHAKRQATFLEKLRDIKRSRGEHDTVRTFVDRRTIETKPKETQRQMTAQMRKEIDKLNARVVKGDTKALARLQEIYSKIDEADSEGEVENINERDDRDENGEETNTDVVVASGSGAGGNGGIRAEEQT